MSVIEAAELFRRGQIGFQQFSDILRKAPLFPPMPRTVLEDDVLPLLGCYSGFELTDAEFAQLRQEPGLGW